MDDINKMFIINRFLNGSEVAKILQHYEKYTGMEYWYGFVKSEVVESQSIAQTGETSTLIT
jgi:hypothetical protein